MSGELGLDTVTADQTNKETTLNLIASELEAAVAGQLGVAGGSALTLDQMQRLSVIIVTAHGDVTLVAAKRMFGFSNPTSDVVHAIMGTTSIAVPAETAIILVSDGTANGLVAIGGAVGTGGGTGGGITDAPNDGQLYGRKSQAWAVVPAGGGGSGGSGGSGTAHKAWRITATSTEANDGPCSAAVITMAATAGGANVALNANGTAFADAAEGSHPATNAFDGDSGTFWGGPTMFPAHVGMIFTTPQIVTSISMTNSADGYWIHRIPLNFTVEYSDDTTTGSDGTWTAAFAETQTTAWGNGETRTFTNASPTTGSSTANIRYVMWTDFTCIADTYVNIMEVKFMAGATQHVPVASHQSNAASDGNLAQTYDGVDTGNNTTGNGWAQNLQGQTGIQVMFVMWDLGAAYDIDSIVYTSRDDYPGQGLQSVRQLVSTDGVTFVDVGTYLNTVAYSSSNRNRTIPLGR